MKAAGRRRSVQAGSEVYEVVIQSDEEARVNGQTVRLDSISGHVLVEGRSVDVLQERDPQGRLVAVWLGGQRVPVEMRHAGSAAGGSRRTQDGRVTSPMNGQVVKVLCQEGQKVEQNECIMVLEAMKMENEVRSPIAGTVVRIDVKPGQTVRPSDPLFTVEF